MNGKRPAALERKSMKVKLYPRRRVSKWRRKIKEILLKLIEIKMKRWRSSKKRRRTRLSP